MDVVTQGAAGQNGSNGSDGQPGQNASAVANSATDTTNAANATGGMGGVGGAGVDAPEGSTTGGGPGGDGGAGGDATASAVTTAAGNYTIAAATASGGNGGGGAEGGYPTGTGGIGAKGGDVAGVNAVDSNSAGEAVAEATASGGAGGTAAGDLGVTDTNGYHGTLYVGADGGTATDTTASAVGSTGASAAVDQTGGAGGDAPQGGKGASSTLTNAVTGATTGGTLSLEQLATGGAGGDGFASTGGQAGAATSTLTFDDTASPTQSAAVDTENFADAGAAGAGAIGAVGGADASTSSAVTGAHDVRVTDDAVGGIGGASGAAIVADAGGDAGTGGHATASAAAVSTSDTGNVTLEITARGGQGGAAEDGSYGITAPGDGGDGGQATIGAVSGVGGATADVEAELIGGTGGTSGGAVGGAGADATLTNAVTGSTHGGTLTLDQSVTGGDGGDSFGGTGGQGGNATSDLTFDDTTNANQSAEIDVNLQAQAGVGGLDQTGANPGLDQMGTSYQLSGNGGSATASGTITAADTLPSGTGTHVVLNISAAGNRGVDGGDATATGVATGGLVNVAVYATAGAGETNSDVALEKAGTARATATGTDAGGSAFAQANAGLDDASGTSTDSILTTALTQVSGTSTASAIAGYGQTGTFDTTSQVVSDDFGGPTNAMGGTDVGQGESLLFDAEQGGRSAPDATGSQTTTSTITSTIDLSGVDMGSEFLLDLRQASLVGTGVTGVTFDLSGFGGTPLSETFTDGASAEAYFTDHVIDLGGFDTLTDDGSALSLTMSLAVTTDDASSGFYAEVEGAGVEMAVCYLRGTRILTPTGEVPIERLAIGDALVTRFGGIRPIKWIGRQSYAARFVKNNRDQIPIRIKAGALGDRLPLRDLFISPGHSMLVDGTLVLAKCLVNGVTITQDEVPDEIHYHQIEFETHDCVIAEGAWSESYADVVGLRGRFHNAHEFAALYADYHAPEVLSLCAPRPEAGAGLDAALRPIVARATARVAPAGLLGSIDTVIAPRRIEGWAQDPDHPELPVLLEVLLGDQTIGTVLACDYRQDLQEAGLGQGRCAFFFDSTVEIGPEMMAAVRLRRLSDGVDLVMSADCRTNIAGAAGGDRRVTRRTGR